jgi:enoyl-CoA hydratase/carnithine racemase
MRYKYLEIAREGGVAVLTLNRPEKRNALSPNMLGELTRALSDEDRNRETRVVLITGAGDKAFCAGFDLSEIDVGGRSELPASQAELIENTYTHIREFGKPVIAMINGACMGAGCDLITNCDFRIAAEGASFALPPARLGIVFRWEGILRFMQLVGPANAKDIFMTGRVLGAA